MLTMHLTHNYENLILNIYMVLTIDCPPLIYAIVFCANQNFLFVLSIFNQNFISMIALIT